MRPQLRAVFDLTSAASSSSSSSSRIFIRTYAASPTSNPHLAAPTDTRVEVIRQALYPPDAVNPSSSSPTGSYLPDVLERLRIAIPNPEVHETIERAWKLSRRELRDSRAAALKAKHAAMVEACDELDRLTSIEEGEGRKEGVISRAVYDRAMARMDHAKLGEATVGGGSGGRKKTPESRFVAGRIEGLIPREAWVPTETRGKGWNYDWKRPGKE